MTDKRVLTVKEYLTELLENGKIDDVPHIARHKDLNPTYVIKKTDRFFIAKQPVKKTIVGGCERLNDGTMHVDLKSKYEFGMVFFDLIYYPTNPDHAELFSRSYVKRGGPKEWAPGAVAMLNLDHNYYQLSVGFLQYCFIQGSPPDLTRSIAARYMGARHHLLNSFFDLEIINEIQTVCFTTGFTYKNGNRSELERVLDKHPRVASDFIRDPYKWNLYRKRSK